MTPERAHRLTTPLPIMTYEVCDENGATPVSSFVSSSSFRSSGSAQRCGIGSMPAGEGTWGGGHDMLADVLWPFSN